MILRIIHSGAKAWLPAICRFGNSGSDLYNLGSRFQVTRRALSALPQTSQMPQQWPRKPSITNAYVMISKLALPLFAKALVPTPVRWKKHEHPQHLPSGPTGSNEVVCIGFASFYRQHDAGGESTPPTCARKSYLRERSACHSLFLKVFLTYAVVEKVERLSGLWCVV